MISWKNPAAIPCDVPREIANRISPIWPVLEYASIRLILFWLKAENSPIRIVTIPIIIKIRRRFVASNIVKMNLNIT